jgi:membrane protein YqaA with SNARE-associated domain
MRILLLPAVNFVVAGYLFWLGIRILTSSLSNIPEWIGWFCVVAGVLKASLWSFVAVGFIRHPQAVMVARHWE